MFRFIKVFLFISCLSGAGSALADENSPYQVIANAGNNLFTRIASEQQALKSQPELMANIVDQELMPYVDHRYAAFKILGKNLRTMTKAQREAFVLAMKNHLSQSYVQVLSKYTDQQVTFQQQEQVNNRKIVSVKSVISQTGKPDIEMDFRLRKNKNSHRWLTFDIVVEGISLLDAKQAEISAKIRANGIDQVIAELAREV
ncbi:MlaC/ttg2D family ABC transporter substrate-binding protein [Thalassomonas actiniarum]|uniref:ABC transporter substrate-binding protein n=1 Tax=Thalassomonas actiniarum TaxID=485447 RepID=A0AAE9YN49_9GAMM|nr:ABC transporter substrate-binding protein [Thalassomonas actiniarum]WDD97816.1 ABC transporter substrate-binding protein [Thalassomonas actiniarum]